MGERLVPSWGNGSASRVQPSEEEKGPFFLVLGYFLLLLRQTATEKVVFELERKGKQNNKQLEPTVWSKCVYVCVCVFFFWRKSFAGYSRTFYAEAGAGK